MTNANAADAKTGAAETRDPNKAVIDGFEIAYETDPNAHNRVEPEDRGPGMDEPVHYTYAKPGEKPPHRDVRVCDAARAGDHDRVRDLVTNQGLGVHQRAEQDWTPLHFAAGNGDLKMVKLLVEELGALPLLGRDRRSALAVARAAEHREVVDYLTVVEKRLGVWRDPVDSQPYCKAYMLRDLRKFGGWREQRLHWTINPHWPEEIKAEFEKPFEDDDVVFVHHDYQVTKSMWHGEQVIFEPGSSEWARFCTDVLMLSPPEELG